jgi:hypothetical protein
LPEEKRRWHLAETIKKRKKRKKEKKGEVYSKIKMILLSLSLSLSSPFSRLRLLSHRLFLSPSLVFVISAKPCRLAGLILGFGCELPKHVSAFLRFSFC